MAFDVISVLKASFSVMRKNPIVMLPLAIGYAVLLPFEVYLFNGAEFGAQLQSPQFLLAFLAFLAVIAFVFTLFDGFSISASSMALSGKVGVKKALHQALSAYFTYLLASLLTLIVICLGFAAFIVPGIYLGLRLSLVSFAVIVDRLGPVSAMEKSWQLAKGNLLAILILSLLIFIPYGALVSVTDALIGGYFGPVITSILSVFFFTLSNVSLACVYKQLRK